MEIFSLRRASARGVDLAKSRRRRTFGHLSPERLEGRALMTVGYTGLTIQAPISFVTAPDGDFWYLPHPSDGSTAATDQIDRIAGGVTTTFTAPSLAPVERLAEGPDGNIWFTEWAVNPSNPTQTIGKVGRITPSGTISEFTIPSPYPSYDATPGDIESGPGGDVWFVVDLTNTGEPTESRIASITPSGQITEFTAPGIVSPETYGIATRIAGGSDGSLYYTEPGVGEIGRISPSGAIAQFAIPGGLPAAAITPGPDGNVWFTVANGVGRITPAGAISVYAAPGSFGEDYDYGDYYDLGSITAAPDGNVWFTEFGGIAKVTPAGVVTEYETPVLDSLPSAIGVGPKGSLLLDYFFDSGRFTDVVLDPKTSPPTATATPETAVVGESVATEVAHFTGTDPLAGLSNYRATIRWSEGYAAQGIIVPDPAGGYDVYAAVAASPLNALPGADPATITIFDTRAGGTSTATVTGSLVVAANPHGFASGPDVSYGASDVATAISSTSLDGSLPASTLAATISFGDGTPAVAATVGAQTFTVTTPDPGFSYEITTFTATATHHYVRPGPYIVTVEFFSKTQVADANESLTFDAG